MQIILGKMTNVLPIKLIRKRPQKAKDKFLTSEIVEKLKQSEKEIERGEVVSADIVFKELREKYGY